MNQVERMLEIQAEHEAAERADEGVDEALYHTTDEGLLQTFAALTHRLHAAEEDTTPVLRSMRDRVQAEILRRMR